ncbi:transcriptional activator hap3 [Brettanomyces nanus]|uniref:Transcriptional activator hap3 n=1 Tax=Eeniella nana TaxID=13502 RepID=A0A875S0Q8_EENNA|nr:transcriptional activator hap3 [Brettanomyces nanus]QPG73034.1 transcriptional activator hap3 [Brettanomyces nanus]
MTRHVIHEQDQWLPITNVSKIMRKALPSYGKLSKTAANCMQECVSEFISFLTSQAAEKGSIEQRKTLNGEDILYSMYSLGFENYAETLKIFLAKYREYEIEESESRREKYLKRKERKRLKMLQENEKDIPLVEHSPSEIT